MDEYERLVRLSARLKDQIAKMTGLSVHDPLREAKYKVEIQISELLLAEAATAPVSSDSSPNTIGPLEKPLPSPGASPVSSQEQTTDKDTSESFKLAQSGMAGESLEPAAIRYLRETNESWQRYYSLALERMSESPTKSGESPGGASGGVSHSPTVASEEWARADWWASLTEDETEAVIADAYCRWLTDKCLVCRELHRLHADQDADARKR